MSLFRADFPIFTHHPNLVYLDSAATTQKPEVVIERISSFYRTENATIHRGLYPLSIHSTTEYGAARAMVASFINAPKPQEVIFTRNATEGINLVANTITQQWPAGSEILLSEMEHHANLVPWQEAARRHNLVLTFIPVTETGEIDYAQLPSLLTEKTVMVSLTHCSNVLGRLTDIPQVKKILGEQGSQALLLVDASQSLAHFPVNIQELGCDFLVGSGHKIYAPSGIGILWGREALLATLPPYQTGGDMIKTVSLTDATWNDLPWKFEAGTPNIEGALGLAAALDYLSTIGFTTIQEHTSTLSTYLRKQLQLLPEVEVLGDPTPASGIISFTVASLHPHDVAELLGQQEICIRAGHQCAAPLHDKLGIAASNRASLGIYNTEADCERLMSGLKGIINDFQHV